MERTVLRKAILRCIALIGLGATAAPSPSWATDTAFAGAAPKADASKSTKATDPAPSVLAANGSESDNEMSSPEGKVAGKKVSNLQGVQVVAPRTSI
ncbi:MAG: hypothetical protein M3Y93_13535, partial [Pseudomonadota bacterium]|nr:hypothetical protein [Pseudomonadota bacterium]